MEVYIESTDREIIASLERYGTLSTQRHGIDGIDAIYGILIALSPVIVKSVCDVMVAAKKANKSVDLTYKGIKIKNSSEEFAERVLKLYESNKDGK